MRLMLKIWLKCGTQLILVLDRSPVQKSNSWIPKFKATLPPKCTWQRKTDLSKMMKPPSELQFLAAQ